MKILVLGSGWMGSAVAYDLNRFGKNYVFGIADQDHDRLAAAREIINGGIELHTIDCNDDDAVSALFKEYDIAVSAVPYPFNSKLTVHAIETGTHFLDLGGNSEVVRQQISLHEKAEAAGVTIIPNCGLAPGLSNILAMTGFKKFDRVHSIKARVGGLPQHPRPPLKYQLMFSVEGLINEYLENAELIDNGVRKSVPSMTGLEEVGFGDETGELEAFITSGGLSLLPELLQGKVTHLSYKTIRYRGHCEKFKTLLDLGFAGNEPVMIGGGVHTSRELFSELLRKKLTGTDPDIVLFRVDVGGEINGERKLLRYEMIDRYDPHERMTAMMRTTAYPTSIIALMIAGGELTARGVFLPEQIVDGENIINELKKRNVEIAVFYGEEKEIKKVEQ